MACMGVAVVGVFLNWIDPHVAASELESRLGIEEDDGFLVIVVALIGTALAYSGAKPAWIAPAFGAAVAIRDASRVADNPLADVGFGLWVTIVGFSVAAGLLVAALLRDIRETRSGSAEQ